MLDAAFKEKRNELVLNLWAAGMTVGGIARSLGITKGTAAGVIYQSRLAGDDRAAPRIPAAASEPVKSAKPTKRGPTPKPDGPTILGKREYNRRYMNARRHLSAARMQAFLDGSAYA